MSGEPVHARSIIRAEDWYAGAETSAAQAVSYVTLFGGQPQNPTPEFPLELRDLINGMRRR